MDREYLKHIDSSPYVDEGFFDTAKAAAAGIGQRAKNYLPSEDPYETPLNAKLKSYYNTLINELKQILKEFSLGPKSPAERLKKSQLSPEQKELIDSLTNLYQTLVPSVFPAGTRPDIRGAGVQRTVNPPNVSFAKSMQHLAKEAWIGRAGARSGGEADSIINKYVNDVKAAYSKFIKNVGKYFPGVLSSKVSDSFKKTLGNSQITKTLDKIETVTKSNAPEEETPTPPAAPVTAAPAATPTFRRASSADEKKNANDFATLIAATLNIISQRVIEDKDSRPYYSKPLADGNFYLPKTVDEPYPLRHSSEWNPPHPPHEPENLATLPDTDPSKIKYLRDKGEYEKKLASYRYVPIRNEKGEIVSYTYKLVTPSTLQSVPSPVPHVPQSPEPIVEADDSSDIDADNEDVPDSTEDEDPTGEFLYDFASLFRKHRGSRDSYSIEVTRNPVKVVFGDGREMVIRVFWNWSNQVNTILVQTLNDGKSWETSELLKFYDDEVNPQGPYYESNFNIAHFLEQVEPNAKALFLKADKEKWAEVENAVKVFKPAAYAVIRRKGVMEFKSHKRLRFYIDTAWENSKEGDPHWGSVKLLRGKFGKYPRNSEIPFEEIHKYFYTKKNEQTQETFENALTQAGYWDDYIGIKEKFKEPAPITTGNDEDREESEAPSDETRSESPTSTTPSAGTVPTAPTTPSGTTLYPVTEPVDIKSIPAAIDAVASLKTMKIPLKKATELVKQAVEALGPDKTASDYSFYAFKASKAVPPVEPKVPETPKAPEIPEAPVEPKQPEPVEAPKSEQPPVATARPEKTPISPEKVFELFNEKLKSLGLDTLENIDQLKRLNSIKGGYNTAISNKANALDDENEKNKLMSKQLKGEPTEDNKEVWAALINKAKTIPKPKKKTPDVSEGIINPFQLINFI